jgi:hypothetical protein
VDLAVLRHAALGDVEAVISSSGAGVSRTSESRDGAAVLNNCSRSAAIPYCRLWVRVILSGLATTISVSSPVSRRMSSIATTFEGSDMATTSRSPRRAIAINV